MGSDAIALNFLKKLHRLFHVGFGDIKFLKCILSQFKFFVSGNIKVGLSPPNKKFYLRQ